MYLYVMTDPWWEADIYYPATAALIRVDEKKFAELYNSVSPKTNYMIGGKRDDIPYTEFKNCEKCVVVFDGNNTNFGEEIFYMFYLNERLYRLVCDILTDCNAKSCVDDDDIFTLNKIVKFLS